MKVYRLEHREWVNDYSAHFVGPYTGTYGAEHTQGTFRDCTDDCVHYLLDDIMEETGIMSSSDTSPMPTKDGISQTHAGYSSATAHNVFGFDSLSSLKAWFHSGSLDQIMRLGYVVREYNVSAKHLHKGGKQLVFNSAHCGAGKIVLDTTS